MYYQNRAAAVALELLLLSNKNTFIVLININTHRADEVTYEFTCAPNKLEAKENVKRGLRLKFVAKYNQHMK